MPPVDNWHHFHQFVAHHSSALPARGISFSPPENVAEPWTIRTNWTEGELMRMLLRVRPSERSLQELISYADLFVCTRHGNGPLAGIENAGVPVGRLFPAPFITAPSQHENNAITLLYTNCLWLKHHDDSISILDFEYCLYIPSILFCIQILVIFLDTVF